MQSQNEKCNVGNESKVPKQLFQFIIFQQHPQKEANSPEKRRILVSKITKIIAVNISI